MQDLPDVEGDKKYDIGTFAATYGANKTAAGASLVLASAYLAAIALPLLGPVAARGSFRKVSMIGGHAAYLLYFAWSYFRLNAEDMNSLKQFYKRIWNLFYLEYLLYPLI